MVLTEFGSPASILSVAVSDVIVSINRNDVGDRRAVRSAKKSTLMMGFATSVMTNFHWNARRIPRSRRKVLIPYVLMVIPLAANISYVNFSVRPLTRVRGSAHRSEPVSTRNSVFVSRSVTKRRLVFG